MIKRFCNRCGKIYDADISPHCSCRATVKAIANHNKKYDNDKRYGYGFYQQPMWRHMADSIRKRDGGYDKLQYFFFVLSKQGKLKNYFPTELPNTNEYMLAANYVIQRLRAVLMDADNYPRNLGNNKDFTVHHIIPRTEDYSKQYLTTNLITVSGITHNLIHELYNKDNKYKTVTQRLLCDAMEQKII